MTGVCSLAFSAGCISCLNKILAGNAVHPCSSSTHAVLKNLFFVYTAASHNMAGYSKWHAKLGCCFATGSRDSKPPAGVSGGAASLKDLHS